MTGDVNQDILIVAVTKCVYLVTMELTAEKVVADTVSTMNHVIISVGLVQRVVKTVSSEHPVTTLVVKDILAQIVHRSVHQTVDLTHVYTQTDHVPCVLQAGWDIIVLQHAVGLLE